MCKRLSIAEKKRVLDMLDEPGSTQSSVAKRLGISRKSVYNAVANREAIIYAISSGASEKRCHTTVHETFHEVNELTLEWFRAMREKHGEVPVVESVICSKAMSVAKRLGCDNFKASKGWFRSWTGRCGIRSYKVRTRFE